MLLSSPNGSPIDEFFLWKKECILGASRISRVVDSFSHYPLSYKKHLSIYAPCVLIDGHLF